MGCPKQFSVHGGMGSELLKTPQRIKEILTTLVSNLDKPVTCKIRLLDKVEDTVDLVKMIESCGVKALAVHARYIPQRPREPAHIDLAKHVVDAVNIPVIVNGDIFKYDDIEKVKNMTGCASVMIGRGALHNCSIFSPIPKTQLEVAYQYTKKVFDKASPRLLITSVSNTRTTSALPNTLCSRCSRMKVKQNSMRSWSRSNQTRHSMV